jgi:hypothetical protein
MSGSEYTQLAYLLVALDSKLLILNIFVFYIQSPSSFI